MKKFFFIYLLLSLCSNSFAINVKIKLHHESSDILNNIDVCFWEKSAYIFNEKPSFCAKSNASGLAEINLPPAEYYVFAEKKQTNKNLFGFFGLNPLRVKSDTLININLIDYPEVFIKKIKDKVLKGKVFYKGIPVKDAEIFLYLDLTTELKGPPFISVKTDENGFFSLMLEEGSYYLFIKKKKEPFGPPKSGDLVSFFPKFPLKFDGKNGYDIHVEMMKVSDKITDSLGKFMKIYGIVKDKNNKIIDNVYVVAYDKSEILGKPKYISSPTDKEGKYTIFLKDPGKYYIVVRKTLGDTPEINDFFVYGEIDIGETNEKKIDIIADFNS